MACESTEVGGCKVGGDASCFGDPSACQFRAGDVGMLAQFSHDIRVDLDAGCDERPAVDEDGNRTCVSNLYTSQHLRQ
jgi:hypothetical protein